MVDTYMNIICVGSKFRVGGYIAAHARILRPHLLTHPSMHCTNARVDDTRKCNLHDTHACHILFAMLLIIY